MINFNLKDTSKPQSLIYLIVWNRGKRIKISTGQRIEVKFWNSKKQRLKNRQDKPENAALNRYLDYIEAQTKLALRELTDSGKAINAKNIKTYFAEKREVSFYEFFYDYITTERRKKGFDVTKKMITVVRRLKKYDSKLTFNDIDKKYIDNYTIYLQKQGLAKNTIYTHIKIIKQVLKASYEQNIHKNDVFKTITAVPEQVDNIYLSREEIEKIYQLTNLSQKLQKSRDRFLIGCYTGLRYNDFSEIIPANIQDGYLKIKTRKTGRRVVIPVHPHIYEILRRNNNRPPSPISNQKLNEHLKEIAQLAGINQDISIVRTEAGQRVERIKKKHELVSTHTARRSFATNAYLSGIPVPAIMQITGHTSYKSFLNYVKVDQERNAELLKNHEFFNK